MAVIIKGKNPRKPFTVRFKVDGRQRERSFTTRREAQDFKIKFEHDSREHIFTDPRDGAVSFVQYARDWLASRREFTANTLDAYRGALNVHIAPAVAGRTLAQVARDREGAQALLAGMAGAGLSASRQRTAGAVLAGACQEAVRAGRIPAHRLDGIAPAREAARAATIVPVTREQLDTIAGHMAPRLRLLPYLLAGCGLRIGEALAVAGDGFVNGTLTITCQATRDGGTAPLKARKAGESRSVPVPAWLRTMVDAHITEYGTGGGYLFVVAGRLPAYRNIQERFTRGAKAAGLPAGFTLHSLRHVYASTLLAGGVPISDLSKWLGHRSFNITVGTYGHLMPDSWERGRQALDTLAS